MDWFIGHLIGDYLLQTDWMAVNKKSRALPCLVHVGIYTVAIGVLTWWPWWALLVVAATHFVQDRTHVILWWMRVMRQTGFTKPPFAPWSLIVVDNVWHLVVLYTLDRVVD
ncbi:MAG: DUF3307 domain-containing protein [Planctomycetota bacterium]|nr:DUF3307 domain-containing protein [Planctomycetaceae bacterium]MDQ3331572.1 DUF3307 domain-containing protein [Planctomycetota bacterium]